MELEIQYERFLQLYIETPYKSTASVRGYRHEISDAAPSITCMIWAIPDCHGVKCAIFNIHLG